MNTATFLLLFYSGVAGAGNATLVGVEGVGAVGTLTATGFVQAPPQTRPRHVDRSPVPPPIQVGARAYLTGVQGRGQVGRLTASGEAAVVFESVVVQSWTGRLRASGAGTAAVVGLEGRGDVRQVKAVGAGGIRLRGLEATGGVGVIVGHPDPAEAAWLALQRTIREEDELILLGAIDR